VLKNISAAPQTLLAVRIAKASEIANVNDIIAAIESQVAMPQQIDEAVINYELIAVDVPELPDIAAQVVAGDGQPI